MRVKFNGDVEVKPMEWLCIVVMLIIVVLLVKENDNEVKGEGNSLDYGARIYYPRVGDG